uniref:Uncharacterized protein n=1 Tax=Fagus sylvatica TaxID=28930 RepID=A0A2N9FFK2_FAGSY
MSQFLSARIFSIFVLVLGYCEIFLDLCANLCQLSDSGSRDHRQSSRLVKGKAVAYARDSSPDTDDEYDAMENPRTRAVHVVLPTPSPGITIGGSARLSGIPRHSSKMSVDAPLTRTSLKRPRATRTPPSADPIDAEFVVPGVRHPLHGGIRPWSMITILLADTPLLMNLANHPTASVCRSPSQELWSRWVVGLSQASVECSLGVSCFLGGAGLWPFPQHPIHVFESSSGEMLGHPLASTYLAVRPWPFWASVILQLIKHRTAVDCIRDEDILFQPYTLTLIGCPKLVQAFQLSQQRVRIRTTKSWELFMGERTVRQLSLKAIVPVDPLSLMTIEDYIPATLRDAYLEGVDHFPDLKEMAVQRLEDQLLREGLTTVTRTSSSSQGRTSTSSSPSPTGIPRDWFFAPHPPAP